MVGLYLLCMTDGSFSLQKGDFLVLACAIVFALHILVIDYFAPKVNGVAYTLQIVGQRGMNPTAASLILSLESAVSLLAGWVILGQKMSGRELTGCILMFIAIVIVQLPSNKEV